MKRFQLGWMAACLALLVGAGAAWAELPTETINRGIQEARQGNTNKALEEIFNVLLQQQTKIDLLMRRSQDQQEVIDQQKTLIQQQSSELSQQREQLDAQKEQLEQSPRLPDGFADNYSADKQYQLAYDIQHIGIFEVRRKEMPPYLEKAIVEYRKVVEQYPTAQKAPEAQYRIAKLYHRYLKDYSNAVKEYKILLEKYPNCQFAGLAQQALSDLR